MTKVKIVSNPYNRSVTYFVYKEFTDTWENIKQENPNTGLWKINEEKIFLPFKVKEIVDLIIAEYYVGLEKIELIFEGTADEYEELVNICNEGEVQDKVHLTRSTRVLENARDILSHAKEAFIIVQPIIKNIVKDDVSVTKELGKVSDALKDIIPICIFGNYSAGKSTFINALIGYEILPSGGDPVTSKIYEIKRSRQADRARVSFSYRNEKFELLFDNKDSRVITGDKDSDVIQEIQSCIAKTERIDLFMMVNITIDILNSFEKKDKATTLISDVIRIEVPFCGNGKLGQSQNDFVIFDTPGSNSNTNMDHEKVLTDSLDGFSNGIPVWVSGYDSIDSVDNAHLCDKLYQIEALDKRFTMIVVNKADSVELPKNGLGKDEINDIMEYESVEKMYSSGIYFVSSIMGLGAKNSNGIITEYLLDVFEEKERKFSDPSARSYKKLYEYNIMPEQMKRKALEYSLDCKNLIYANSGIYCVEMEIEQFASKYAAYNKCQMMYSFLKNIIDETGRRINAKTTILEKSKRQREQNLDEKKYELIEKIKRDTEEFVKRYKRESEAGIRAYMREFLTYELASEKLETMDREIALQKEKDVNFASDEREFEGAKSSRWKNLVENGQNLFKGNFVESFKDMAEEWESDSKIMQQKKRSMDDKRQNVDEDTSDRLLSIVILEFKNNILDAQSKLKDTAREYWQDKALKYQDEMIHIITGADTLSEKQRMELANVVLSYPAFQYDDKAEKVFIKNKFLRGNVLGIKMSTSERLDTKRLAISYNLAVKRGVREISRLINNSCFNGFTDWQKKLQDNIENKITIYNPELREITEFIHEEEERICDLQTNQKTISTALMTIENMMDWKELE